MRILFLGENWYGSCARACCHALRRLGNSVIDIDAQTFFPQVKSIKNRLLMRLWSNQLVKEYNSAVLKAALNFHPNLLLAFKANYLHSETLRQLRDQGISLYNYYPDTSVFTHGKWLAEAICEYDCIFSTKRFLERDLRSKLSVRNVVYLPHGYDQEIHHNIGSIDERCNEFICDVGVIATHTPYKEKVLEELVKEMPALDLQIWGNQWELCRSSNLKSFIRGIALNGDLYRQAIKSFRINLAIMSGEVVGASQGDETTTRTYEIPACGGFMLHQRSAEVLELFGEDKEIACFENTTELVHKIRHYLTHKEERESIANAGYKRCVPAYSYDNRMSVVLDYHNAQNGH